MKHDEPIFPCTVLLLGKSPGSSFYAVRVRRSKQGSRAPNYVKRRRTEKLNIRYLGFPLI
jgi:hypothetical protein